jgi:hypothetical protein
MRRYLAAILLFCLAGFCSAANLAITAAEVLPTSSTESTQGISGAVISAGDVVWFDSSSTTWKLFDGNDTSNNTGTPRIALTSALVAGQPITVATGQDITIGATAAASTGIVYVASTTAGKMCPAADLATGNRVTVIGVGKATAKLQLVLNNSGVTYP